MQHTVGISVEEFLNLEILINAKLLSGSNGISNKITKINVMEVPDIVDWVKPGEFLLTTGYSIKEDISLLNKIIPELSDKGVAGLGIKTKRYVDEIPESVIKTSDKYKFPIIEIPYDVSYADIIMPVLTEVVNTQTVILKRIAKFNERLTRIMLNGGSIAEIAKAINKSLGVGIAIAEDVFKTHVLSCEEVEYEELEQIINQEFKNPTDMKKNDGTDSYVRVEDIVNGKKVQRIMLPINTEDESYGKIMVWEDMKQLTSIELSVIEASRSLIALDLMKKLSIFENENKHKIEFFDDLLSDDEIRKNKAMEKANYFDFNKGLSYSVVIISLGSVENLVRLTPNNTNYLSYLNSKLVSIVERLSKLHKNKVIYGNKSARMIILFGSEQEKTTEQMKKATMRFCTEIMEYAKIEMIQDNLAIGVGRNYADVYELSSSMREANRAVENLQFNTSASDPIHYDDLGIYRILSYEELQPELKQFYNETLEPLVKYDKDKDSDLVETLNCYFACGSNLKRVSEEMYTHYNTVIYRMQRIKEIANLDLDDPNQRLNVQIALKILNMLKD